MIAFLFSESPYEEREQPFLAAVAAADTYGMFRSRMFYGTLLLTELTRQLVGGTRRRILVRSVYQTNMRAYQDARPNSGFLLSERFLSATVRDVRSLCDQAPAAPPGRQSAARRSDRNRYVHNFS
jgi:hypothetical protein